jgi:hypothetical protein
MPSTGRTVHTVHIYYTYMLYSYEHCTMLQCIAEQKVEAVMMISVIVAH